MQERYERKYRLEEMAHVGDVNQLSIDVYTDHNPPHFHVTKKDEFEVKITIKNIKIIDYVWQKSGKKINSKELKDLNLWLNQKSNDNNKITNYEGIKYLWKTMN